MIAHLLTEKISNHRVGVPLRPDDHNAAVWLLGQLICAGRRLDEQVVELYDVAKAAKEAA